MPTLLRRVDFTPRDFFEGVDTGQLRLERVRHDHHEHVSDTFPLYFVLAAHPRRHARHHQHAAVNVSAFLHPSQREPRGTFVFTTMRRIQVVRGGGRVARAKPRRVFNTVSNANLIVRLGPQRRFNFNKVGRRDISTVRRQHSSHHFVGKGRTRRGQSAYFFTGPYCNVEQRTQVGHRRFHVSSNLLSLH